MFLRIFLSVLLLSFAANAQPKVLVSFPALHSLTAMVMDGVAEPQILLNAQQDAHHMQLKPSQMQRLSEADLFIYYSPAFEVFVPKLQAATKSKTQYLALSDAKEEDHHEGHDHHGYHDHHEPAHEWLNPEEAQHMLDKIAAVLIKTDPANAKKYQTNAKKYKQQILIQTKKWQAALAQATQSTLRIASDHPAFMSFTDYFKLPAVLPLEELSGEVSVKRLKAVEGEKLSCVIATHGKSPIVERLSNAKKITIHAGLNPMGSGRVTGKTLYFQLLGDMVRVFMECLH